MSTVQHTKRLALTLVAAISLTSSRSTAHEQGFQPHAVAREALKNGDAAAVRRAGRRSLRFELSAFPQYWAVFTEYPEATLEYLEEHVETNVLQSGPIASGWALGAGARYHYLDRLGVQARLVVGIHAVYAGVSNQLITMTSGVLELSPIIGPIGRFYVAPTIFGGALLYDGRAFLYPEGDNTDLLRPLLVYGAGGEVGLHLGPHDEVALLLKMLAGEVAGPPPPLTTDSSVLHLAAGASIAF